MRLHADALPLDPRLAGCPLVVGFSGGADSIAALLWAKARGHDIRAVIIDHGISTGSAARARQAEDLARELGVHANIISLSLGGVGHARARTARLEALAHAAAANGGHLVLGHQASDQAETVLMRLARPGLGLTGLAGIAPVSPFPLWPAGLGILVQRPLLRDTRDTIRASIRARGITPIDDPANVDPTHERVRARSVLAGASLLEGRLVDLAARAATCEQHLRHAAADALEGALVAWSGEEVALDAYHVHRHPLAVSTRLVRAVMAAVSGKTDTIPEQRLIEVVGRWRAGETLTCAGAWLSRKGGRLLVRPDPGRVRGRRDAPHLRPRMVQTQLGPVRGGRHLRFASGGRQWLGEEIVAHVLYPVRLDPKLVSAHDHADREGMSQG